MPLLVTMIVLVALFVLTSWSAKATSPLLAKAGTAPANSLPISANVFDVTPPAGRPGPPTRKKLVPSGLPMNGGSVAKPPMKPAGGAHVPAGRVRNCPYVPASGPPQRQRPTR